MPRKKHQKLRRPTPPPLCVWACCGFSLLASYFAGAQGAYSAHEGGASFAPAANGLRRRKREDFLLHRPYGIQ